MTPNFALFDPPVKIRGGVGEIPLPIVEALPTTELRNTVRARWIDKIKKKKKEILWVKLKAFSTNVGLS